jgi:AraC-like DNA-binding protein
VGRDAVGLFRCACDLIDGDLRLSLTELSALLGTHRHTLESIITRQAGCTFTAWRRDRRLRRSQELLLDLALLQKEVASAVGLTPSRLTALFRDRLACTPTEYRASCCGSQPASSIGSETSVAPDLDARATKRTGRQARPVASTIRPT